MARWSLMGLVGTWLPATDAERLRALHLQDPHLHAGTDAICPRCLRWVEEDEFVRRTAYGPLQHEVCPAVLAPVP